MIRNFQVRRLAILAAMLHWIIKTKVVNGTNDDGPCATSTAHTVNETVFSVDKSKVKCLYVCLLKFMRGYCEVFNWSVMYFDPEALVEIYQSC